MNKEPKKTIEQDKIRRLHDCNSDIYDVIDRLKEINTDVGLAFQNLRSSTLEVGKAIGKLIDESVQRTTINNDDGKNETQ